MNDRYDLIALGGGTGGLISAAIAAGIGARVALVERDRPGGDCLWTGCVPSKTLIAAANLAHRMRHADAVGLEAAQPRVDFARVMARVHEAIATIEPHDSPARLRAQGIDVIAGEGRFVDARTIAVDGSRLRARAVIVATGSEPVVPPVDGLTGADALTSETVWGIRELPRRLVVLGGGPIGCELGQAFARLGSQVTLVEMEERLLANEEPAASELIAATLQSEGVDLRLGTKAVAVDGADLTVEGTAGRERIDFDRILAAAGRRPRTTGIGLEAAGIELQPGGAIRVDERLRTTASGVYAVGDVTGLLPFTHVAAHHARIATVNALFRARRRVSDTIPWVTFTDPEVGRVGLTEAQARERWGHRAIVERFDYAELDRTVTDAATRGFAQLVADPRGRLVGATVAAPAGGESIAELTARVQRGDKIDAVSTTVHAYPTFAEGPSRAADDHLRRRYTSPRVRAMTRPLLALLRLAARA